jgi:F-type H+-transporting ATPase subunit epsilon
MATSLQVDLVTPESRVFSGPASEVVIPAWEGEMGIYPDHDTLLTLLRAGTCTIVSSQGALRLVIGRGFAEIGPDRVTILTDSSELVSGVDREKAARDLAAADAAAAAADPSTETYRQARIAAEHAQARLSAAG